MKKSFLIITLFIISLGAFAGEYNYTWWNVANFAENRTYAASTVVRTIYENSGAGYVDITVYTSAKWEFSNLSSADYFNFKLITSESTSKEVVEFTSQHPLIVPVYNHYNDLKQYDVTGAWQISMTAFLQNPAYYGQIIQRVECMVEW